MSADVVEGEGKRGQQGGDEAIGIEMERGLGADAEHADDQRDSRDRQRDRRNFLQGKFLLSAGHHIKQDPDRRGVLHDDGGGDVRPLDGDVIKIVRTATPRMPSRKQ